MRRRMNMSKELEALNYLVNLAVVGNKENNREKVFTSEEIITKALKRNEPMKPLLKDMGFEHYDIYCPSCKEYIGYKNSVRQSLTLKYCPDCVQKLDRSEIR